jgi:hypothetical protein
MLDVHAVSSLFLMALSMALAQYKLDGLIKQPISGSCCARLCIDAARAGTLSSAQFDDSLTWGFHAGA